MKKVSATLTEGYATDGLESYGLNQDFQSSEIVYAEKKDLSLSKVHGWTNKLASLKSSFARIGRWRSSASVSLGVTLHMDQKLVDFQGTNLSGFIKHKNGMMCVQSKRLFFSWLNAH